MLGPGPCLVKKRIYRAAVSQRLRNNGLQDGQVAILMSSGTYRYAGKRGASTLRADHKCIELFQLQGRCHTNSDVYGLENTVGIQ